jgi:tagatose-6-phosphate ketose/aldose isomerase
MNGDCLVAASLSTDPARRGYEVDLLRELRGSGQGKRVLVVCDRPAPDWTNLADEILPIASDGTGVTQDLRPITDVVVGQLIGLFACLSRGLKPDAPSRSGVIARVVPGFTLH